MSAVSSERRGQSASNASKALSRGKFLVGPALILFAARWSLRAGTLRKTYRAAGGDDAAFHPRDPMGGRLQQAATEPDSFLRGAAQRIQHSGVHAGSAENVSGEPPAGQVGGRFPLLGSQISGGDPVAATGSSSPRESFRNPIRGASTRRARLEGIGLVPRSVDFLTGVTRAREQRILREEEALGVRVGGKVEANRGRGPGLKRISRNRAVLAAGRAKK
jgi:hypothetical protein